MTVGGQRLVTMSGELRHTIRDMEGSMETTASALLNRTVLSTVLAVGLSLFVVPAVGQEHQRDFRHTPVASAGTISATAVDSAGRPLHGACVQLWPKGVFWSGVLRETCSDSGHFRIPVRLGTYDVFFSDPASNIVLPAKRVVLTKQHPEQRLTPRLAPPDKECGAAGCGALDVLPFLFPEQ